MKKILVSCSIITLLLSYVSAYALDAKPLDISKIQITKNPIKNIVKKQDFSFFNFQIGAWSQFSNNAAKTGRTTNRGPYSPDLSWKKDIGGVLKGGTSPVVANNSIYVAADGLYSYDMDGKLKNKYYEEETLSKIVSASKDTSGFAMSLFMFKIPVVKWQKYKLATLFRSPAVSINGTVYVTSEIGILYALKGSDLSLKWMFCPFCSEITQNGGKTLTMFASAPVIGKDGNIYIKAYVSSGASGFKDSWFVYSIRDNDTSFSINWISKPIFTKTGDVWLLRSDNTAPAIDAQNNVIVRHDNSISMLSSGGDIKWTYNGLNYIYGGAPVIGQNGDIYLTDTNEYLNVTSYFYILSSEGKLKKALKFDADLTGPAIGMNGEIYITSSGDKNKIHAYGTDGVSKWSYAYSNTDSIQTDPVVDGCGDIYIASNSRIFAFNNAGKPVAFSPSFLPYGNFSGIAIGDKRDLYLAARTGSTPITVLGSPTPVTGVETSASLYSIKDTVPAASMCPTPRPETELPDTGQGDESNDNNDDDDPNIGGDEDIPKLNN